MGGNACVWCGCIGGEEVAPGPLEHACAATPAKVLDAPLVLLYVSRTVGEATLNGIVEDAIDEFACISCKCGEDVAHAPLLCAAFRDRLLLLALEEGCCFEVRGLRVVGKVLDGDENLWRLLCIRGIFSTAEGKRKKKVYSSSLHQHGPTAEPARRLTLHHGRGWLPIGHATENIK